MSVRGRLWVLEDDPPPTRPRWFCDWDGTSTSSFGATLCSSEEQPLDWEEVSRWDRTSAPAFDSLEEAVAKSSPPAAPFAAPAVKAAARTPSGARRR